MTRHIGKIFSIVILFLTTHVFAATYGLPPGGESLVGRLQYSSAGSRDTVVTMAKQYDIGFNSLQNANPDIDPRRVLAGSSIQVPTLHLLPSLPRQGIVINLPEMRLYYYPEGNGRVMTFPIGIGKIGKTIPIVRTSVSRKATNPTWIPPEDIRQFNLGQGVILPKVMPPGPDNPLGPYAIYLRLPTYLIHSTPFIESIGRRASFGCIRMYQSDIESFFSSVKKGIPVVIINSSVKAGWQDNHLYLEAHPPLEEHSNMSDASLSAMVQLIMNNSRHRPLLVDWQLVSYLDEIRDGIPHEIGTRVL